MVTRLCLDRLPLPEPIPTDTESDPLDRLELLESINTALLLVLETLSPLERAVFILYEAFGYAHADIAELLGISLSHSRQLLHRARHTLGHEALVSQPAGMGYAETPALLCDDVVPYYDGDGKASAATIPLEGITRVVTVFSHLIKQASDNFRLQWREVNEQRGLVVRRHTELSGATTFDI